jgi:hypothetical protein
VNQAEDALKVGHLPDSSLAVAGAETLRRLPVYLACTALAVLINYALGEDMAWDTLNYQFYAGFSAINDRFAQDYFAAGPPSYFNPFAYAPFYAMVRAGLSPLEISSVLAAVHSVILWLTFELAVLVCPSKNRRIQMSYGVCAVALAFVNPILIQQIGSSFADITTAELTLGGWLLLAHAVRKPNTMRIVAAGLLLGTAVALKLTNAVHAIAASLMLIMVPGAPFARIRRGLAYAGALGVGFAVVAAPWSYRLERMFGNPMFPLMNGLFRSPEFTTEPLRHFRFIPESLIKGVLRPFELIDPIPMVQEELVAPDMRYAVLIVLIAVVVLRWLWERRTDSSTRSASPDSSGANRVLTALGFAIVVDWMLWLSAAGNGRYFLPMASVTAVMIVALVFRLLDTRAKARNYLLAVIFGAQLVQLYFGAHYRWNWLPWGQHWLTFEVPEKLATEPNLYLTVGVQSNSFIAPFLAKGSGLINFSGGYALGPEGPSGARIEALIRRYQPNLRVLWSGAHLPEPDSSEQSALPADDALVRFGLRVDTSDCATIAVHGLPPEAEITYVYGTSPVKPGHQNLGDTSYLTTCRIVTDQTDRSALVAREHDIDLVFDHLEDACPALFQPRRLRTEHTGQVWRRLYVNTDLVAQVYNGTVKFLNPVRGGQAIYLGPESDWLKHPQRLSCGRRNGQYFARVLQSKQEP